MVRNAVLEGPIPRDGVIGLLRTLEERRTSGVLVFEGGGQAGEVQLVRGQFAHEQPTRADGLDPVEVFLGLRDGRFALLQRLPDLPVTEGDAQTRRGSLAVHAPADLMSYCERAGLTGVLRLDHAGRVARILYDRGELTSIVVDGAPSDDVDAIFAWDEGRFEVQTRAASPDALHEAGRPPSFVPPPTDERTSNDLLRVVEMRLARILETAEQRRPRTLPPPTAPAPVRTEPKDSTVRVIYLGTTGEALLPADVLASFADEVSDPDDTAPSPHRPPARPSPAPVQRTSRREEPEGRVPLGIWLVLLMLLLAGLAAFVAALARVE